MTEQEAELGRANNKIHQLETEMAHCVRRKSSQMSAELNLQEVGEAVKEKQFYKPAAVMGESSEKSIPKPVNAGRAVFPQNCRELATAGQTVDGIYLVQWPSNFKKIGAVYCDFGSGAPGTRQQHLNKK